MERSQLIAKMVRRLTTAFCGNHPWNNRNKKTTVSVTFVTVLKKGNRRQQTARVQTKPFLYLQLLRPNGKIKLETKRCMIANAFVSMLLFGHIVKVSDSISDFIADLRRLAQGCNFSELEIMLRDRPFRLFSRKKLSFESALEEALLAEAAAQHTRDVHASDKHIS
ncbi:hypothetical protein Tsp_00577 [Trichinella spiralis]|uniref:hypothetical protein n=1 Tax=Trichinella spiralis TaxID=6334 RepID=UPI0001EFBE5E|nr:hypothetical protein Tsp_00577 [Trichinella spiralis]